MSEWFSGFVDLITLESGQAGRWFRVSDHAVTRRVAPGHGSAANQIPRPLIVPAADSYGGRSG